jgi:hypothetical protein
MNRSIATLSRGRRVTASGTTPGRIDGVFAVAVFAVVAGLRKSRAAEDVGGFLSFAECSGGGSNCPATGRIRRWRERAASVWQSCFIAGPGQR